VEEEGEEARLSEEVEVGREEDNEEGDNEEAEGEHMSAGCRATFRVEGGKKMTILPNYPLRADTGEATAVSLAEGGLVRLVQLRGGERLSHHHQ